MKIADSVALVTGANRGIGLRLVEELLARGAAKVYATARVASTVRTRGVEVLELDVTDPGAIAAVAAAAPDVTLLVNNAGIATGESLLIGDLERIRAEMETHVFGPLQLTRSFAPVLAANGGGAVVNMLSALSWFAHPGTGSYAAAKAAEWNLTNALRLELAEQGTLVTGVHLGAADTDMTAGYDGVKVDPVDVARAALDGVEARRIEVVVDDWSAMVKASLADDPATFYREVVGVDLP